MWGVFFIYKYKVGRKVGPFFLFLIKIATLRSSLLPPCLVLASSANMRLISRATAAALLVTHAFGHPAASSLSRRALQPRLVDLNAFRLTTSASYSNVAETAGSGYAELVPREDYVEAATAFVQSIAPGIEFRVATDHYIGTNGIGHVTFKQTAYGLDIDNADFNVNVRPTLCSNNTPYSPVTDCQRRKRLFLRKLVLHWFNPCGEPIAEA